MADFNQNYLPTATEIHDAVCRIRRSTPGVGIKKLVTALREKHGWSIHTSRLRKLVAPGGSTESKAGMYCCGGCRIFLKRPILSLPIPETLEISSPTLLGVLSHTDIRGRVLGPLLTVTNNKMYTQNWSMNFPGMALLHVSSDIREMAWKFFRENNIWVQAQFVWDAAKLVEPLPSAIFNIMNHSQHSQPALVQATFVPDRFTPDMLREFQSSVAVTISVGRSQGQGQPVNAAKEKTLPVFFAFHPGKFALFTRDLADTVSQWCSMTVEVNHAHIYKFPDTIPIVVDQIMRGLGQIREASRVTSTSLEKDSIDPTVNFKTIAQTMMSPREVNSETRAKLLEFYTRGTKCMHQGQYREAYDILREGHHVYEIFQEKKGPKPKLGSIESNMIEHVVADILGMASEALNREISAGRSMSTDGYAGPRLMTQEMKACDTSLAVVFAQFSLSSPGLTDGQRFQGHYRRAVAFSNLGDFLTELKIVVPESERVAILADVVEAWSDAVFCYRMASQDAFYAAHVAGVAGSEVPQELVNSIHAVRRQMCDKLGYDADEHFVQMQRAGLTRLQLPVLGLWEGDPQLYAQWGPHRMMLMALFRQREGSGGPIAADLREALAQRGLRWMHDQRGQVYLEGMAEAHMNPTYVLPDDTSNGLQAAGLLENTFDLARR